MAERERWGSRIGLILAMAGNAIGLGNFLRFPVQAASNGGGAFLIPYFIAFLFLGIPLMWVEWTIGRHGGKYGHGSLPGMFDVIWHNKFAKYLGVLGLFATLIIMVYYTYIESWTMAFSFFSITDTYFGLGSFAEMKDFLESYQGQSTGFFTSLAPAYIFFLITFAMNYWILRRGLSGGIELLAKIGLPALFVFGIILATRIIFLGTPDPVNHPDWSVGAGFAFAWNPNFSLLSDAKVWLAAAGQIFFTLSVGMGCLHTYASFLKPDDDLALSGLATSSLNGFAEVVLGGSIAIPIAVAFFGVEQTQQVAITDSFNLGFVAMPIVFQHLPFGELFGFAWFFMLFIAGITSSVAMATPIVSFLEERFQMTKANAVNTVMAFAFVAIHLVILFLKYDFLDEMDFWGGTMTLVLVSLVEVILFGWVWGMKNSWKELNTGADIKVPKVFYYIIKYITPVFIIALLFAWSIQSALPELVMDGANPEAIPYRWFARGFMVAVFVGLIVLVRIAWRGKHAPKPMHFTDSVQNNGTNQQGEWK